jgi:hypothetical protein
MGVFINVARGTKVCAALAKTGRYSPINPWSDWLLALFEENISLDIYYAMALEQMRRCDAILLTKGWQNSGGTVAEVKEAISRNIVVFDTDGNIDEAIEVMDQYFDAKDNTIALGQSLDRGWWIPNDVKSKIITTI